MAKKSRTAEYYEKNPKARKKRNAYQKKYNQKPREKKKRRELGKIRYWDKKKGKFIDGKDYDHASGKYIDPSKNRGKNSGSGGDKRARGKKKKNK